MIHNPYDDTALLILIALLQDDVDDILEDTIAIREVTDSEAILTEVLGSFVTDGTEQTVYVAENPAGIFEPRLVTLNFTNQTVAGTSRVRVYYREEPGGGYIKRSDTTFAGVQDPLSKEIILRPNRYGIRVSLLGTGETVTIKWEAFYEEAP